MTDIFEKLRKLREKEGAVPAGPPAWILVGLGNPGLKYEDTRHNAGFMALDTLAERLNVPVKKLQFKSLTGIASIAGENVLLMKPQTFMNNSGEAVGEAMRFYKLPPERVIVLFDDISLPVGGLRIRRKGSDGGHNGMKSIILHGNSDAFPRVKIGVGAKPHPDYELADWVLSRFTREEGEQLEPALADAGRAAELMVGGEFDRAMNLYNQRGAGKQPGGNT